MKENLKAAYMTFMRSDTGAEGEMGGVLTTQAGGWAAFLSEKNPPDWQITALAADELKNAQSHFA